ncbi:hypothetical protein bthur0009_55130 [Bacillus thuringiensis serovar andalousiensis BGSC 4AW1]|nr:hypothetical protein bthur0009_55130 [Bacillus thuringiensis serovar andalousiensis BGSC 4AW1]
MYRNGVKRMGLKKVAWDALVCVFGFAIVTFIFGLVLGFIIWG